MKRIAICAAAAIALGLVFAGCQKQVAATQPSGVTTPSASASTAAAKPVGAATAANPGLTIKDIKVGAGAEAKFGSTVTVNYTGWLTDGTKFDSSLDRNEPFSFTIGAKQVIPGWEKGVVGMKVGGKRKLTIGPELGYGANGIGPIPPNATLVFDIELLKVQ